MIRSSLHAPVVALAAACTLLVNLGGPALWDDDEPKNAACSLAMLDSGDWIVPTYNGRLRVEKPPLVNWVQAAGFSLCGRNETGARIGSALLTVGSCLLTWGIGRRLFGGDTALVGGLAFATCVWTAIGGRAATPDAPLVFCTTLALWLFVRHGGRTGLSRAGAAAVGAACGLATLAKGPVGLLLPVAALLMFAGWRALSGRAATWRAACADLRLPTLAGTALLVALPWYVCVAFLTRGAWLEGFLLVHNVGRFATAMEGHSGSLLLYYPCVVAVGLFPWSIVLVAMIAHAVPRLHPRATDPQSEGVALLACWCLAWIGGFSCSGTKLPGYVWPAYPALALMTALFLVDWARGASLFGIRPRDPDRTRAVVTRVAWGTLALGGLAVGIGLPVAAAWRCPGGEWLGLIGLVPVVAAAAAWRFDVARHPALSLATLAVSACLFVSLMAGTATDRFSRAQGMRERVTELAAAADGPWGCFWNVPPTVVYYARTTVSKLDTAADVARHLAGHPRARVVVDSRHEPLVRDHLPPGCVVLARIPTLDDRHYLVLGPGPRESASLALVP